MANGFQGITIEIKDKQYINPQFGFIGLIVNLKQLDVPKPRRIEKFN